MNHQSIHKLEIKPDFLSQLKNYIFVDLSVFSKANIENKISASLDDFFSHNLEDPFFIQRYPDKSNTYVCICEAGLKSKIAAKILTQEGYKAYFMK